MTLKIQNRFARFFIWQECFIDACIFLTYLRKTLAQWILSRTGDRTIFTEGAEEDRECKSPIIATHLST